VEYFYEKVKKKEQQTGRKSIEIRRADDIEIVNRK
jgi:hypothetical protein